jgi:epoxyqueuosine reductase QueG
MVVALLGAALGLVISVTSVSSGSAAATSYCTAARGVDDYHGNQKARLAPLLDRVQHLAPVEIASVVTTMRATNPRSAAFAAAKATWGHFNTNHCCSCIGGPNVPQVVSTAPDH